MFARSRRIPSYLAQRRKDAESETKDRVVYSEAPRRCISGSPWVPWQPANGLRQESTKGTVEGSGGKRYRERVKKLKTCGILQSLHSLNIWALVHWGHEH
jgi:hypothetical protein